MIQRYCKKGLACILLLLAMASLVAAEPAASTDVAEGNDRFALALYQRMQLAKPTANVFYSPFSVSNALVMTYAGSRGETEAQMAGVLQFVGPQDALHRDFSALLDALNSGKEKGYRLEIANALWGQQGYSFEKPFLELTDRYYQGAFQTLDFAGDTENSRRAINQWVEKRTDNKIKELLKQGDLSYLTRLVLTNAVYFKGDWQKPFRADRTREQPFRLGDGRIVNAPLMTQSDSFAYAEREGLQLLELPYAGGDLAMLVLLPSDSAADLAASLSIEQLQELRAQLAMKQVEVTLPKFKFATRYYLDSDTMLPALGMKDAFDSQRADFSGINGRRDLSISHVIHQAMIDVNEQGSEAAASTAVVIGLKSMPMRPTEFRADHPFLFLIVHKPTNSILFMGTVNDVDAGIYLTSSAGR